MLWFDYFTSFHSFGDKLIHKKIIGQKKKGRCKCLLYLLLLILVDERWLSCFDLVNLKAHTRSLVNERYISERLEMMGRCGYFCCVVVEVSE